MNYHIKPTHGWENFSKHNELLEEIEETFILLVNQYKGEWHYMSFVPDSDIFEDPWGNSMYLEYNTLPTSDEKEIEYISQILLYLEDETEGLENSLIEVFKKIEERYQLEREVLS